MFWVWLFLNVCSVWWNDTEGNKNAGSDNIRIQIAGIVISGLVDIDYGFGMNSFSVRVAIYNESNVVEIIPYDILQLAFSSNKAVI